METTKEILNTLLAFFKSRKAIASIGTIVTLLNLDIDPEIQASLIAAITAVLTLAIALEDFALKLSFFKSLEDIEIELEKEIEL